MFVNSFFLLSTTFMTLLIQKNNFSLWFLPLHLIFYSFYCKIVGNNKGNRLNLSLSTKDNKTIQHFFFCWKQEPQCPKCFESYIWKKLESCNTLSCNVSVFYQTCKKIGSLRLYVAIDVAQTIFVMNQCIFHLEPWCQHTLQFLSWIVDPFIFIHN